MAGDSTPTVVLVHGGFVDGSGWEGVYSLLKKDGYDVSIVQNPTLNLAGDVASAAYFLEACARGAAIQIFSNCAAADSTGASSSRAASAGTRVAVTVRTSSIASSTRALPPPSAAGPCACRLATMVTSRSTPS